MIRQQIQTALAEADPGDSIRVNVLRLMRAALKDREAALSAEDGQEFSDADAMELLRRMIRQREDSISGYEQRARMELAEQERREIAVIREFLPKPLSEAETEREVDRAIRETQARSIRDLGRVMGLLKRRFPGRMDFARAGRLVKSALG
jgi:uncharacterized protein YqeY